MTLHIKSPGDAPGVYPIVRRGQGLKYLSFTVIRLGGSLREHVFESGEEEISLDFYSGPVRVESEGWSADVPARASIGEPGSMVYIPAGRKVKLTCLDGEARITAAGAQGKSGIEPAHIPPTGAMKNSVGKDNWSRTVYTHIGNNLAAAHLICGETINRPGGWSSCPPHKHDRFAPPSEVPMEEAYYFLVEPRQGFGFMRVYTDPADPDPFDHAYAVENGDTVLIPRGYHPVVACPGYTLNYTWVLAGEGRTYGAWSDDPKHAWIKTA
ncbi:MAG TPA: 5-deoxy-glucuronate isomerase [Bryobacteraceae bacterium]|nr:5-deoxy-glucuronate isomerase [Bryobacteraceae bacterium]